MSTEFVREAIEAREQASVSTSRPVTLIEAKWCQIFAIFTLIAAMLRPRHRSDCAICAVTTTRHGKASPALNARHFSASGVFTDISMRECNDAIHVMARKFFPKRENIISVVMMMFDRCVRIQRGSAST